MHLHLLPMMVQRPNCRPTSGMLMPVEWRRELPREGFEVNEETVTDGNCGIHAFAIALIDAAESDRVLDRTSQFKKVRSLKGNLKELILHLRRSAFTWMRANVGMIVWDDMNFRDIAVAMAGRPGRTFGDQCNVAARDREWIDCSVLLALACVYSVDVVVHQQCQPPAMLGPSLMNKSPLARVHIAMINDVHFWGLCHLRIEVPLEPPEPRIVDRPIADADDGEASLVDYRNWYLETQEVTRPRMDDGEVAQELRLCNALLSWDPFAAPSPELIAAVQDLRTSDNQSHLGLRCLLRQSVVEELQYEQDHLASLPKRMLSNAAARYRMRQDKVMMPQKRTHAQMMGRADTIEHDKIPGTSELIELLTPPCHKGHSCLDVFRQSPQAARNWRVMWRSTPPSVRRERLNEMAAKQLKNTVIAGI